MHRRVGSATWKNRGSRLDGLQVSLENMLPVEAPCLFYFSDDQSDAAAVTRAPYFVHRRAGSAS